MKPRARLALLALLLATAWVVGRATGLADALTAERLRESTTGVLGFLALFVLGELVHVPGLVFVGAAVAIWGPASGGAIAAAGSLLSLVASFVVVRAVGGRPLETLRWAWARRVLDGLERRPVRTVAALRAVLVLSPPVTYALALSGIRFRDYLLGSAIGLVPPLAIAVLVFDRMFRPGP